MRTAILGCGAMGTILGAYLTKNEFPVELIDSYKDHVIALRNYGARVTGYANFNVPVKAVFPEEVEGFFDLVILLTKQTSNDTVLPWLLPHLHEESIVCTLQNGIPEPYVAKWVGEERTIGGAVLYGATFIEPGVSELTQDITKRDHVFRIGEIDGKITPRLQKVAEILSHMGPVEVSATLMQSRWSKLMANACMSGMSAACGCDFGHVLENEKASACLSYIGHEVKLCCDAEGYTIDYKEADALALKNETDFTKSQAMFQRLYSHQPTAKASMLQDLEKGRKTEIQMLNGHVCKIGRKHGIETPYNDAVVSIITGIEEGRLPLSLENLKLFPNNQI